ncbi:PAN domain-containing protein [Rhizobium leguminosarum]|nr:PAN domain-containing protein [Rhizobium leguminosarum]UIK09689.1 PAN domain-containing protein [Rhizobium leguminosarum]
MKDVSFSECHATCEGEGQCKGITYNTKYGVCFLKKNVVARSGTVTQLHHTHRARRPTL